MMTKGRKHLVLKRHLQERVMISTYSKDVWTGDESRCHEREGLLGLLHLLPQCDLWFLSFLKDVKHGEKHLQRRLLEEHDESVDEEGMEGTETTGGRAVRGSRPPLRKSRRRCLMPWEVVELGRLG